MVLGSVRYKRRNPWGVFLLALVTVGIYGVVWYYKVNNEVRNYGIENNPTTAVLALALGWILVVPPFVSYYRTADRVRHAQERAQATERILPWVGLALWFVNLGAPVAFVYYQSQLNRAWDAEVVPGRRRRARLSTGRLDVGGAL